MPLPALSRSLLSSQAADLLREQICLGRLAPGARIVELSTARELGLSRTPLREALIQLEGEGLVVAASQGFRVAPASAEEVRDLYPILGSLEVLALRSIEPSLGSDDPARIEQLRAVNARMHANEDPGELIRLDAEWHGTLLEASPNRHLLEMVDALRRRMQRYEYLFMQQEGAASRSPLEHDQILDALERADLERAASILEHQWADAVDPVLSAIRERAQSPESRSTS